MMRLFVALYPSPAALADLDAALAGVRSGKTLRWAPRDQWHVTLAFLGEVRPEVVDDVSAAIGQAVERSAPFSLRLHGAGSFDGRGGAVVWTGVAGDLERLLSLSEGVGAAARAAGATYPDRRAQPHLTLGREPRDARGDGAARRVVAAISQYAGPAWDVVDVRVVHSVLGPPLQHTPIAIWPLGVSG